MSKCTGTNCGGCEKAREHYKKTGCLKPDCTDKHEVKPDCTDKHEVKPDCTDKHEV